jgi:RNA polymerase sigma factor (sigma-70 family)
MTTVVPADRQTSDADLVAASRDGDRDAFGQIVQRYQGMVSGLIYAACGDLHRSEDLAQDTFIAAWKGLPELRDPSKLAGWLCQIARNRFQDQRRKIARETAQIAQFCNAQREVRTADEPQQDLLAEEESDEMLWRTLSAIPHPYRETLVLYYRQGQSAAQVAAAMEITETAVRQRLMRGRLMLREQMEAFLERKLSRSAPSATFTMAVVGALPAITSSATAASIAAAAKGGAAKASYVSLALTAWIAPIVGLVGGFVGTWVATLGTRTLRERQFIVRSMICFWLFFVGWMGLQFSLPLLRDAWRWRDSTFVAVEVGYWSLYAMIVVTFIILVYRRRAAFSPAEGLDNFVAMPKIGRGIMLLAVIVTTAGSLAWMIGLALAAGDQLSVRIVAAAIVALIAWGSYQARAATLTDARGFSFMHLCLIVGVILAMVNWRLDVWIAGLRGTDIEDAHRLLPMAIVNLVTIIFLIWTGFLLFMTKPRREK